MSGEITPPRGNTMTPQEAQIAQQVQQMLLLMEQNMQQMQEAVLGKLDQMTDRIVQLEQSLNKVMDQAGIDPAQLKAEVDAEMKRLNELQAEVKKGGNQ